MRTEKYGSTVAAFDVVGGLLVFGVEEQVLCTIMFDDFPKQHEDALITNTASLSHVVRDNDNGILPSQCYH